MLTFPVINITVSRLQKSGEGRGPQKWRKWVIVYLSLLPSSGHMDFCSCNLKEIFSNFSELGCQIETEIGCQIETFKLLPLCILSAQKEAAVVFLHFPIIASGYHLYIFLKFCCPQILNLISELNLIPLNIKCRI